DGSCISDTGFPATGDLTGDPLLGPLQDNGGPTWTQALLSGSQAINAGLAQFCAATDQRGENRDARCDGGAYEATFGDIAVTGMALAAEQVCLDETIAVNVFLSNPTGVAVGPFTVHLYEDNSMAGNTNLVQSSQISGLAANASQTAILTYSAAITGTRYLKVVADLQNQVVEANETNNRAQALLSVNGTPGPHGTLTIQATEGAGGHRHGQDGGESYTRYVITNTLTLALTTQNGGACRTQPTQMRFFADGQYTAWEPFAAHKSLTVAGNDGDKLSVFAQLRDADDTASELFGDAVTLDLLPPDSHVIAPSGVATSQTLTVTWAGVDAVSGVHHYDVQRQVNGGNWEDFQTHTASSSAILTNAQFGSTYCFRARATDNAGNAESYPASADTCVAVKEPAPIVDLLGVHLEFTQSIQNPTNSMPLITDRPLLARLTVGIGAGSTTIANTNAVLHVFRNNQELPGSPLIAQNGPITARAKPNRDSAADLLHFRFPAEWLNGELQVYAQIDPQNRVAEEDETNNRFPANGFQTISFQPADRMQIVAIPIRLIAPDGKIYEPTTAEIFRTMEVVRQTYPIAGLEIQLHAPYEHQLSTNEITGDQDWIPLIYALRSLRRAEAPARNVLYYGIVPRGLRSAYGGLAFMPGTTAIGLSLYDQATWQEIGHNMGQAHVACERASSGPDPNYPYANGVIGNTGWNYVANQLLPATYKDFMSYCNPTWLSDYTYLALHKWLVKYPAPMARAATTQDGLLVAGQIGGDGLSGSINAMTALPNIQLDTANGSDYRISYVLNSGEESFTFPFALEQTGRELSGGPTKFTFVLPTQANLKAVRLFRNNILLDEKSVGDAPTVDITSAPPASASTAYTLTWTGTPGATYMVRFSPNNGVSWQTITAETEATSVRVGVNYLAGATQGLFEVRASANLQTAVDQIGPFSLDTKAPVASIEAPQSSGQIFGLGETITFIASGYDFEDGVLAAARFAWASDRDGALGSGSLLAVDNLSVGVHTITLSVTDSDNQTTIVQIQVEVLPANTTAATRQIAQAGVYEFGATGAMVEVINTGGCLQSISVQRTAGRHPNATDQIVEDGYWSISQTGCSATSKFLVNLTLPAETTPDANRLLCRYTGEVWDCASAGFDAEAGTVTRTGINSFSDWAVGRQIFILHLPTIRSAGGPGEGPMDQN
ncbi:MAG: hypothetical protein KJZ93_28835, partial [Caldilineaceae bacterium]|nr:hypothetical protein [Caldilineaceae bacterium]